MFILLKVQYLTTLGGKDITSRVNRILKYYLADSLAESYSFFGKRNQKKAFAVLNLKKAIICK